MSSKPHILIIEDCREVAEITRRVLELDGFEVTCVEDGDQALAQLVAREFDMLISDIDHPGASTAGIFQHAREARPTVPFLLSTGYTASEVHPPWLPGRCDGTLQKPWRIHELRRAVREFLPGYRSRR